jgi:hypothetical protein
MRHPCRGPVIRLAYVSVVALPLLLLSSVAVPTAVQVIPPPGGAAASSLPGTSAIGSSTASTAPPQASPVPTAPVASGGGQRFATSPTPGTITDYEYFPGGATTEDPSLAYDSVSSEPILNVYETLVNYNGSSTSTFVPTLATCVPGTVQCGEDYPIEAANTQDLITYNSITGLPMYYTFVIDQNAKFYDPLTHNSWNVYPSDVVFSVDRTMAFADASAGHQVLHNGWLLSQALIALGNRSWDVQPATTPLGLHFPYNNTPFNELSSILVNDSTYCPASAMSQGHGCVTFEATGNDTDWPFFLELVADGEGASVEPCGTFTYDGAGLPGWAGTNAADGDGPCLLPGGATSTDDASFQSFLVNPATGGNATYWDPVEELGISQPYGSVQPGVRWTMTGSGPYFAYSDATPGWTSNNFGLNYSLHASPVYAQPAGCRGLDGYAAYPDGYCDPATGSYPGTVNVNWELDQAQYEQGVAALAAGAADFATILPSDWAQAVALSQSSAIPCPDAGSSCGPPWFHSNRVDITLSPTLINNVLAANLDFNLSFFGQEFPTDQQPVLPSTAVGTSQHSYFFSGAAVRGFLSAAYPYASLEQTTWTEDGIPSQVNAGGPLPSGLGDYYPTNYTFPYQVNGGVPSNDSFKVGSAAWWFTLGTSDPSAHNSYYDPLFAECRNVTCTFPLVGQVGDTQEDNAIDAFILQIEELSEPLGCHSTSCAALQPYRVDPSFSCPSNGCPPAVFFPGALNYIGWSADYPDPSDILGAYANPAAADAYYDSVLSVLNQTQFDLPACGHSADTLADLAYWAHLGEVAQGCQFVAFNESLYWQTAARDLPPGESRTSAYQFVDEILSELDLYVWEGQRVSVQFSAPWIAEGSISANPMIGGANDELFYQLFYSAPITAREEGLPLHSLWGLDWGGIDHNSTSPSEVVGASTGLSPSNSWSPIAPASYALAYTIPFGVPDPMNVPSTGSEMTLVFKRTASVAINETGLPVGTNWSVTLTPPNRWYPTAESAYDVVTPFGPNRVTFTGVAAGVWDYKVTGNPAGAIAGFKTVPLTVLSSPLSGAPLLVPNNGTTVTRVLPFVLATAEITFTEGGVPTATHPTWSVTVSGTDADGQAYGPLTVSASAPSPIRFDLPQGTYTYSFGNVAVGAYTYTATGGSITLGNLHPWLPPSPLHSTPHYPVHATFTDPPGLPSLPTFSAAAVVRKQV